MTKSLNLKHRCEHWMAEQGRKIDAFPWDSKEAYADWLAQTYSFVCHSTRLLCLAAARFQVNEDSLHLRFLEHLSEERSHEKLCLADLKTLGKDLSSYPEYPETKAFYQCQYYLVEYVSPKALFGYILSLEALAATKGRQIYQILCQHYGPEAAVFVKVHGEEDEDHLLKLQHQLSRLSPADQLLVGDNLDQSCALYGHILERILRGLEKKLS